MKTHYPVYCPSGGGCYKIKTACGLHASNIIGPRSRIHILLDLSDDIEFLTCKTCAKALLKHITIKEKIGLQSRKDKK